MYTMEDLLKRTNPWNSLPPVLSHIHVTSSSFLRDGSCASDDISDISTVTTATTVTNVSSTLPEFGIPIPHTPKPHLQSVASRGFHGYESGYEPDNSEVEGAEHVEFSDHVRQYLDGQFQDDDDIFDFEVYPSVSMDDEIDAEMALEDPFEHESDFEESDIDMGSYVEDIVFDDDYVEFGNSVHFDANISYIESPNDSESTDDDEPQMTMHERMLLARKDLKPAEEDIVNSDHDDVDECYDSDSNSDTEDATKSDTAIADEIILEILSNYSRDMVDIDKQIFVAFINGIHEVTDQKYQSHLQDRVQGFRDGRFQSPFFDNDSCLFLNDSLKHVIGMFRNVVNREEFEELARLAGQRKGGEFESESVALFERIEHLVSERLLEDKVVVGKDELGFFVDGVVYALERPQIYAYDVSAASP
ncbi:hypothetical protein PISL3812_04462 [Talaromyces islandicus]|uniref:Uncharacterized protein n=1 Tax=Talaromyces islandicus TaxID=28573 RepID=A0A0U1LW52_TALIS|nr:hypothetical protein PISL3812_04462 [Talaromyces islandicus]